MSLRDKFYDLGPVVKPRDDRFLRFFILRFFLYRHPGAGRDPLHRRYLCRIRDGINYLDPGVKHRDDRFLSSFISQLFFIL